MKNVIVTSFIVTIFAVLSTCHGSIENIDLNYTSDKIAYDELYMDGRRAYDNENHRDAVTYFERAISDFRHELEVKAQCWLRCQDSLKSIQSTYSTMLDGQLTFLHYTIKMKSCYTLCKERFIGRRGRIAKEITQAFENRLPYSFLQYSYYKVGEIEKALTTAYTYFESNTENGLMRENIDILLKKTGKDWKDLRSVEELPHITLYREGEAAYNKGNFKTCVRSFEESLTLFYKELKKCRAVCEEQHEKRQVSYSASLSKHFQAILKCRKNCQIKMTRLDENTAAQHFVPYYYHYLQYCYFQEGNILEAATAAETYILLVPTDPIMSQNLHFYKKQPSIAKKDIQPRPRAKKYLKQFAVELNLDKIVKGFLEEVVENRVEDSTLSDNDEKMLDNIYKIVSEDLESQSSIRGETEVKNKVHTIKKSYRNPNRWKNHPEVKHATLLMEEAALNGTNRVAFDNVITEEECKQMMQLVKKLTIDTNKELINRRLQQLNELSNQSNLAVAGDGYKHSHSNAAHPFTEKETFEGVTVKAAFKAIGEGKASINETELYLKLSDRSRVLTQEYFDLPKRLNFAFTHLVCRHALADAVSDSDDLSHPIHSDNCLVNADGSGTCPERAPAYTWRDYSALLYLNDDFTGGDFIFADYEYNIQARVQPKCGRMVAFLSKGVENLHGVLGVKSGTRCALPIWFTLSEKKEELELDRMKSERDLKRLKDEQAKSKEEL